MLENILVETTLKSRILDTAAQVIGPLYASIFYTLLLEFRILYDLSNEVAQKKIDDIFFLKPFVDDFVPHGLTSIYFTYMAWVVLGENKTKNKWAKGAKFGASILAGISANLVIEWIQIYEKYIKQYREEPASIAHVVESFNSIFHSIEVIGTDLVSKIYSNGSPLDLKFTLLSAVLRLPRGTSGRRSGPGPRERAWRRSRPCPG